MSQFPTFTTKTDWQHLQETGRLPERAAFGVRHMPPHVTVRPRYRNDLAESDLSGISDVLGQIGAAATSWGLNTLTSLVAGGSGTQAKGTAAITAFGNQAIATLQQILAGIPSGQISRPDAVANAQRIVNALSDPVYVYQAQHGDDAAALTNAKAQAGELLRQIQALAGSVPTTGTTGQNTTVVPVPNQNTAVANSDNSQLLLIGGGLLLAVLLLK
jgi:hypothetical protein